MNKSFFYLYIIHGRKDNKQLPPLVVKEVVLLLFDAMLSYFTESCEIVWAICLLLFVIALNLY